MSVQRDKLRIDIELIAKHRQKNSISTDSSPSSGNTSPFSLLDTPGSSKSTPYWSSLSKSDPVIIDQIPSSPPREKFIKISPKRNEAKVCNSGQQEMLINPMRSKIINITETGIDAKTSPKKSESRKISFNKDGDQPRLNRPRSISELNPSPNRLCKTKTYEALPPFPVNLKDHLNKKDLNEDTSIKDIINHIMDTALKITNINTDKYIKIFEENLIFNLQSLYRIDPVSIDKLKLPLALETEIKNLIIDKNKMSKTVSSYNDITFAEKGDL